MRKRDPACSRSLGRIVARYLWRSWSVETRFSILEFRPATYLEAIHTLGAKSDSWQMPYSPDPEDLR